VKGYLDDMGIRRPGHMAPLIVCDHRKKADGLKRRAPYVKLNQIGEQASEHPWKKTTLHKVLQTYVENFKQLKFEKLRSHEKEKLWSGIEAQLENINIPSEPITVLIEMFSEHVEMK
jgi:hypothetical protein